MPKFFALGAAAVVSCMFLSAAANAAVISVDTRANGALGYALPSPLSFGGTNNSASNSTNTTPVSDSNSAALSAGVGNCNGSGATCTENGSAMSFATASYGQLKALASATASTSPSASPYGSPRSFGFADASFFDQIRNFPGAAVGTPVTLSISEGLHSLITTGNPLGDLLSTTSNGDDNIYVRLTASIIDASAGTRSSLILTDDPVDPIYTQNASTSLTFDSGDVIQLSMEPDASADATPDLQYSLAADPTNVLNLPDFLSSTSDASDTGFFALNVVTPGVSYIAESGTVYSTVLPAEVSAAPEPDSLLLISGAFVWLAFVRRRMERSSMRSHALAADHQHAEVAGGERGARCG
jgi:hypothetical protein